METLLAWLRTTNGGMARRLLVGAVGGSLALAGLALLVLPGPGIPVLLAGLGVLSLEFAIARTWIDALKRRAEGAGVPRRVLWALPAAGIAVSLAVTAATLAFAVVHGNGTWEIVRKPVLGWGRSWISYGELRAASEHDPEAAAMLTRCRQRPAADGVVEPTAPTSPAGPLP